MIAWLVLCGIWTIAIAIERWEDRDRKRRLEEWENRVVARDLEVTNKLIALMDGPHYCHDIRCDAREMKKHACHDLTCRRHRPARVS